MKVDGEPVDEGVGGSGPPESWIIKSYDNANVITYDTTRLEEECRALTSVNRVVMQYNDIDINLYDKNASPNIGINEIFVGTGSTEIRFTVL